MAVWKTAANLELVRPLNPLSSRKVGLYTAGAHREKGNRVNQIIKWTGHSRNLSLQAQG